MRYQDLCEMAKADDREASIAALSSRERRIHYLRVELADKRHKKALDYDSRVAALTGWIEHLSQMSDEDYEKERLNFIADQPSLLSRINRSTHPDEHFSGALDHRVRSPAYRRLLATYRAQRTK